MQNLFNAEAPKPDLETVDNLTAAVMRILDHPCAESLRSEALKTITGLYQPVFEINHCNFINNATDAADETNGDGTPDA